MAKKSWYFFCKASWARSSSVQPGGRGSLPGAKRGTVMGNMPCILSKVPDSRRVERRKRTEAKPELDASKSRRDANPCEIRSEVG